VKGSAWELLGHNPGPSINRGATHGVLSSLHTTVAPTNGCSYCWKPISSKHPPAGAARRSGEMTPHGRGLGKSSAVSLHGQLHWFQEKMQRVTSCMTLQISKASVASF